MRQINARAMEPSMLTAPELRSNLTQRDVVARGIATFGESGTMPAVEYLKLHGVGAAVIERVLLEPGRRRAAG